MDKLIQFFRSLMVPGRQPDPHHWAATQIAHATLAGLGLYLLFLAGSVHGAGLVVMAAAFSWEALTYNGDFDDAVEDLVFFWNGTWMTNAALNDKLPLFFVLLIITVAALAVGIHRRVK